MCEGIREEVGLEVGQRKGSNDIVGTEEVVCDIMVGVVVVGVVTSE